MYCVMSNRYNFSILTYSIRWPLSCSPGGIHRTALWGLTRLHMSPLLEQSLHIVQQDGVLPAEGHGYAGETAKAISLVHYIYIPLNTKTLWVEPIDFLVTRCHLLESVTVFKTWIAKHWDKSCCTKSTYLPLTHWRRFWTIFYHNRHATLSGKCLRYFVVVMWFVSVTNVWGVLLWSYEL